MSPQRQSEGPGAPAEHEDTPLRPVQFDTLLERELQRQTPPAPAALTAAGPPAAKRPFLKRGTGLQRFGLRPGQQVRLRPGRGRAGRAAGRGGRIVLRSAPRGDGPWRPAPGRDPVADPADTLALLGDLRVAAGPAASAARPAPGLSHRPAAPGAPPPPPAGRLNLPSVGRPRSHLPAGAITVEKVARPPGGATGAPDQQPDSTPRGKRELKELRAFELLEQAALDSSFSSNSSFVSNLLHAAQSTPERRGRPGAPAALSPLAAPPAASERPGAGAPVGGDRPTAAPTAEPEPERRPDRAAAARGGGAPAAGPAGQPRGGGGQPRVGTVVRPNVSAAGVTPPPGRPDWSAAPGGRPPDSEDSLDASLAVSPARAAALADSEPEPEEEQGDRLERYRRLRDQLRRELDGRCERAAGPAGWADPLRRSVRFDDQPDVFEITADGSCDVTLTSEAGDGGADPERRPASDRTAGGEQLERGASPERPAGGCGPPEDRAQSRSRSGAGAAPAPAALQDADSARPAGRTESARRPAGAEPFLFDRAGLERQRAALDREAATFREENALLSRLRADLQRQRLDLDAEKERWERQKAEDAERMARRTEQERRKLADERKQFEAEKKRHAEEWRKRETPELKALHAKVAALEAELGRRGSSWSQDAARLRARLAHLTADRDRLERLLQSAHQQLARRNARQFSAGAGPHRSGSVEGDEPAAGRRRTTLSRHRSAPDLADGGGSTSSVSTAGGRSSRGSGPDRGGRKATGAGGRRSLESHCSAVSPSVEDVGRLLEGGAGSGSGRGRGRSGSGGRAESVAVPRRPPPPVRVVRDSAVQVAAAPSLPTPPAGRQSPLPSPPAGRDRPGDGAAPADSRGPAQDRDLPAESRGPAGTPTGRGGQTQRPADGRPAAAAVSASPFRWPAPAPPPPGRDPALALSVSTLSSSALSVPAGGAADSPGGAAESAGSRRDKLSDGTVRVCYQNGDWKETSPQGDTVYFYAASGTRQTTYRNGSELTEFSSGQLERRDPDGSTEIRYPCGSVTVLLSNGEQQTVYRDGTRRRLLTDGSEEVLLPSGKLEVHTDRYKKLVCPDGTIKFVYPDGRQETRYPNGRIRIRDRHGRLVVDTQP